ncbi:MAG TPA: hypothetical protein PKV35_01980 [bacterium]|nr:hypothetical protein [bacterium]
MEWRGEMNIANIFGLHIGCRVKHSFTHDNTLREGISLLTGVQILQGGTILIEAGFKEYNHQFCKLILKPLSKITDEDKADFQTTFKIKEKILGFDISSSDAVLVCTEFTDFDGDPMDKYDDINYSQLLWLASKGYDIGLVPDEYKEVTE